MSASAKIDAEIESIRKESDIVQKVKRLKLLIENQDLRIKSVAEKLGVKSSYVCHLLRLTRLPEVILDGYYSETISLSHLFVISRVKDQAAMIQAYEKVLAENLTVNGTEEIVRDRLYGVKTQGDYLNKEEKENFIQKITSIKKNLDLKIIQTRIKSKIILEIKGDLESTGKILRSLMSNLEMWPKSLQ